MLYQNNSLLLFLLYFDIILHLCKRKPLVVPFFKCSFLSQLWMMGGGGREDKIDFTNGMSSLNVTPHHLASVINKSNSNDLEYNKLFMKVGNIASQ